MRYAYAGKDFKEPTRYVPACEEEARAKFAYFRDAEAKINGGPAPIIYATPAPLKPLRPRLDVPLCGTCSGYARHIRLRQEPCRPCLDARGNYQREYRAKRKAVRQMANNSDQLQGCNRDTPGIAPEITQFTTKIDSTGSIKAAPAVLPTLESGA